LAYDIGRLGSENVVAHGGFNPDRSFPLKGDTIAEIRWMDNDEELQFTQDGDKLNVVCTGFPYGYSYCVRVAKVTTK